ncbi:MAG: FliA/WhiG family RNA polymerase sigma factor [Thermodesulfobacteriota bacterium]|nr:FliA/WhiG family RNA polymerase sigma factor [Thermodesulfobacteriota bacterium]
MVHNYTKTAASSNTVSAFNGRQREEMIISHTPLVKRIATKMSMRMPSSVQVDDLINAGCIGLINAVDRFDPNKDVHFKTYAEYRIRGAIQDELRNMDWYSRSLRKKLRDVESAIVRVEAREKRPAEDWEVAEELGMELEAYLTTLAQVHGAAILSIDEYIRNRSNDTVGARRFVQGFSGRDDVHGRVARKEMKQVVAEAIGSLSEKEQQVVSLYYYDEMTLKEIGEILSVTESRICQIHAAVLLKLKARLAVFLEE